MNLPESTTPTNDARKTDWGLVTLMLMMVAAAHFNRVSISVAGTDAIIPQHHIEPTRMGLVYSAYLLFYTMMMSPGGWFIDRYGTRIALFVVGAGSAVFVMVTGAAGFLWSGLSLWLALIFIRSLMGMVNAPTHPASARLVGDRVQPRQQSLVNGMTNFAACLGMSVTYLVFGELMDAVDWTGACLVVGAATMVLAVLWGFLARSRPTVDPARAGAIRQGEPPYFPPPGSADSIHVLLRNRSLWFLTLSYAALGYFQYLFFYWAQYYFEHVRHVEKQDSRLYASILTLTMGLGMIAGGALTDWLRVRVRHPRNAAIVPVFGLVLSAIVLLPGLFSEMPLVTVACFALAMAAAGASEGAFWTLAVEIGGTRGGLAAGILNTGGNAGGLLAPVLTPYISELLGWQAGLGMASVVCLIGALCWIGISPDARERDR